MGDQQDGFCDSSSIATCKVL